MPHTSPPPGRPHLDRSVRRPGPLHLDVAGRRVGLLAVATTLVLLAVFGVVDPDGAAALTSQAGSVPETAMTAWKALVLGVVEGLTEYLPISSTGHLLVASDLLGLGTSEEDIAAANTYAIAIQFGAILAVAGLFWSRFRDMLAGLVGRSPGGRHLLIVLAISVSPAVVLGLLLEERIEEWLFAPWPIVGAWFVGGVAILWLERAGWLPHRGEPVPGDDDPLLSITYRQALLIGLFQTVAMWPGTSRSLMAILGALLVGVGMAAAVEFSFLLGFVTLTGASVYSLASDGGALFDQFGYLDPAIGLVASFVAAVAAIKWMIDYLQRNSLAIFGWYRIVAATITASLILAGVIEGA